MIYRYPRYGELFDACAVAAATRRAGRCFGAQDFRDLQMLSQLAWFDEEFQETTPKSRAGSSAAAISRSTIRAGWAQAAGDRRQGDSGLPASWPRTGQIEISTTPYYHPILPLLCDSNIAGVAHPNVPLPPRFRYPDDARMQLQMARDYIARSTSASRPSGCGLGRLGLGRGLQHRRRARASNGPPPTAASSTARWHRAVAVDGLYRPYAGGRTARQMSVIFRDHFMSDLIGFVYSRMDAGARGGGFPAPHSRELRRHSGQRPRCPGAHHSRWRKRLGVLRPQRPSVPARTVPPHLRRSPA